MIIIGDAQSNMAGLLPNFIRANFCRFLPILVMRFVLHGESMTASITSFFVAILVNGIVFGIACMIAPINGGRGLVGWITACVGRYMNFIKVIIGPQTALPCDSLGNGVGPHNVRPCGARIIAALRCALRRSGNRIAFPRFVQSQGSIVEQGWKWCVCSLDGNGFTVRVRRNYYDTGRHIGSPDFIRRQINHRFRWLLSISNIRIPQPIII